MHLPFLCRIFCKRVKDAWKKSLTEWKLLRLISKPCVVTAEDLAPFMNPADLTHTSGVLEKAGLLRQTLRS